MMALFGWVPGSRILKKFIFGLKTKNIEIQWLALLDMIQKIKLEGKRVGAGFSSVIKL